MRKNILIAQVGAGDLQNTKYSLTVSERGQNPDFFETKYSFEAFIREMLRKNIGIDYLILIGTKESKYVDIYEYFSEKNDCNGGRLSKDKLTITENRNYIEDNISATLGSCLGLPNLKVKIAVTDYGVNTGELNSNFEILKNTMEEVINAAEASKYEVYFDISNGFRSIPIYIYTMMNYLVRIRKEEFELHMYYGMFEAKRKFNNIAPLVDLEHINALMEWINAANEFHNYGSVKELVKILDKEENHWQESMNLQTMFRRFDYASNANNLSVLKETIAQLTKLKRQEMNNPEIPNYAIELLRAIGEEFTQEFSQNNRNPKLCNYGEEKQYSYAHLTLHLANWYRNQGRIGNASVALQEGITTFVMERWPEEANIIIQKNKKNSGFDKDKILWMSEYSNRKYIDDIFILSDFNELAVVDSLKSEEEIKSLSIREKMNIIRAVIRNPEAHILLKNNISEIHISRSRTVLDNLIDVMISMVNKNAKNEEELYCILLEKVESIREEKKEEDRNCRWKSYLDYVRIHNYSFVQDIDKKDIEWKECFDTFVMELREMKACRIYCAEEEQEMITSFLRKAKTMKYVPRLLSEQNKNSGQLDYKVILSPKKEGKKFGDERLLNWAIKNIKKIVEVFT